MESSVDNMPRYVISDLHLDHGNIIDHCNRPFESIEEMNTAIVSTWNETVSDDDVVFFLGDIGHFADETEIRRWLDRLNGRIVFIEGNHDSPGRYVDGVRTHQYYIMSQGDRKFCCTHRPENAPRFWDGWVLHGHHHNTDLTKYPFVNPETRLVNVSAELVDYRPIRVETITGAIELGDRLESCPTEFW